MQTRVNRSEVYNAIDGERNYQDKKYPHNRAIPDFLYLVEQYLEEAKNQLCGNDDPEASRLVLHTVRKITALGVACMEQHGVFYRPLYNIQTDEHAWYVCFGDNIYSGPYSSREEADAELLKLL